VLWFIGQSWVIIAAAFVLGLLIGYLWWGMLWRRVQVDESRAVRAERHKHAAELAERDRTLSILRQRVVRCDVEHVALLPVVGMAAVPESSLAVPELDPVTQQIPIIQYPQPAEPEPVATTPADAAVTAAEPAANGAAAPAAATAESEPVGTDSPAADSQPADTQPADTRTTDTPATDTPATDAAATDAAASPDSVTAPEPTPDAPRAAARGRARALFTYIPSHQRPTDDLERIEGIGPQMSGALRRAGIHTYADLAAADEPTLRAAIEARGLRFAPSLVTWGRQAQLLAAGDEDGFADLTRRLVAGREDGRQ
jgi:predicted flap endonuclease-1-like 5' DNA nuclease